jgi:phospholipase/carboxylesterase
MTASRRLAPCLRAAPDGSVRSGDIRVQPEPSCLLLTCIETLGLVARHLDPSAFGEVMEAIGTPETALQAMRPQFDGNSGPDSVGGLLARASDEALRFCRIARSRRAGRCPPRVQGLAASARAQEALYPLASMVRW